MSRLTKLLKYADSSKSKKRKLLNSGRFTRDFGANEIKQLSISEANETALVQEEIYDTLVRGAESQKLMRDILPTVDVNDYKLRVIYDDEPNKFAPMISEGSAIERDNISWSKTNIEIKKTATRPVITSEMLEDEQFGLIELEIKKAGARLENKINQEAISILLDDHGGTPSDITPDGSHIANIDIDKAVSNLLDTGWENTDLVLHPKTLEWLQSDYNYSVNFGEDKLNGMNTHLLLSNTNNTADSSWDATVASGHYYGLVMDSEAYGIIGIKRDITTEQYDDPINDLLNIICSIRFGIGVLSDNAAVRIESK